MAFSEAVQWWEEWQLRVLVLGSLFLHYFLFVAAPLRKHCIPSWFRLMIWLAYLGSDAVAIYALATLFNRHKKQEWVSTHRDDASLEALWAPILLVHLGGVDAITAYNIEDNELWRRHVLTVVSQAAVAIYVFSKSWSGDKRLLQAAILIFLVGILKCFEKPVALKSASISSLMSIRSSSSPDRGAQHDDDDDDDTTLKKVFMKAVDFLQMDDLYYPFVDRRPNRFVGGPKPRHKELQFALSRSFDRLYTKEQVSGPMVKFILYIMCSERASRKLICGYLLRAAASPMMFTALGLFHRSHREAYNSVDVKVTYTLLSCTAALDYIGALWFYTAHFVRVFRRLFRAIRRRSPLGSPWPDHIAQYNLIGYLASKKKHWILTSIAAFLGCEDCLDPFWCMKPCKSSKDITRAVCDYIGIWDEEHRSEAAAKRAFNDNRGHWILEKVRCDVEGILQDSLRLPFDQSVLLWHLTTEFCYFDRVDDTGGDEIGDETDSDDDHSSSGGLNSVCDMKKYSRVMSNYMAYLLFVNPEMLMTGARPSLFRDEYERLKGMPLDDAEPTQEKTAPQEKLAKKIIHKLKGGAKAGGIADDAWVLSKHLMDLFEDGTVMWLVIMGVWVEMLCFSASRCRGYLHAKSLGKGGEYLSYIWLLLSRMGMENLADKMQKAPELPKQEDDRSGGGGGAEITTPAMLATTIAGSENEITEPQEKEDSNGGAGRTTPATTITGDQTTDSDGGCHCTTSAAPTTAVIGEDNV
ncbi:unnamed protein product [Urochloa humidicola]